MVLALTLPHNGDDRAGQNLRATRPTELSQFDPAKDVCEWLANSPAIAHGHYAMATEANFQHAVETPTTPVTGSDSSPRRDAESDAAARKNRRRSDPQTRPQVQHACGVMCDRADRRKLLQYKGMGGIGLERVSASDCAVESSAHPPPTTDEQIDEIVEKPREMTLSWRLIFVEGAGPVWKVERAGQTVAIVERLWNRSWRWLMTTDDRGGVVAYEEDARAAVLSAARAGP